MAAKREKPWVLHDPDGYQHIGSGSAPMRFASEEDAIRYKRGYFHTGGSWAYKRPPYEGEWPKPVLAGARPAT